MLSSLLKKVVICQFIRFSSIFKENLEYQCTKGKEEGKISRDRIPRSPNNLDLKEK